MFNTSILGKLSKEIAFIPFQKSGIFTVNDKTWHSQAWADLSKR
jgi:hypothetical protein